MKQTKNVNLRIAERSDISLILTFIKELAEYEKMIDDVTATEEILMESLFEKKVAEVVIAEYEGKPVGFALFFHNFSTFLGKSGIYLEDLYIRKEVRGVGIGKKILAFLAKLAKESNCGRLEWSCLDWNKPSIKFYKKLGAKSMDDWTVFRITGEELINLSEKY